jgi:hypothetical protein
VNRVNLSKELKMEANVQSKGPAPDAAQFNKVGKPKSQKPKAPAKGSWAEWLVPAGLIVLSLIPVISGAVRITQLTGGVEVTPANARFFASPLPVVVHIFSASLYAILGAFQFVPGFRRRRRSWHRVAGWFLIPCGLAAGLSGLWMTLFYPWPEGDGELLYGLRLLYGSAMVGSIVLGVVAIRRRDFIEHGAWMMRGYALGLGAGTQVLTQLVGSLVLGTPNELSTALLMGAGWVINLAGAEWIIRKQPARPVRIAAVVVSNLQ